MTIKDMHYSFKKKLNKVDSQQYRNLLVPEIDWALNEASGMFIKMIAMPRTPRPGVLGFESNQRTIDDIRPLVMSGEDPANQLDVTDNVTTLPDDYQFFVKAISLVSKGTCEDRKARVYIQQHDDMFEENINTRSSFEWRIVNGTFDKDGLRLYDDGTFTITECHLTYIRQMEYMHNAEDFRGNTYALPGQTAFTGTQECELPEHVHPEIVDMAVLITSGELELPSYQIKKEQLKLSLE